MPVRYQSKVKGPGTKTTEQWWDLVGRTNFYDQPLVLADNLRSYFNKTIQEELSDLDVVLLHYPSYAGALLDPCDNSFHAALKRRYYKEDRGDHGKMIAAIRKVYYETSEESIRNYWHHCGYTSSEPPEDIVSRLMAEGFHPLKERDERLQKMESYYLHWKHSLNLLRLGSQPPGPPGDSTEDSLDGVYWTAQKTPDPSQ